MSEGRLVYLKDEEIQVIMWACCSLNKDEGAIQKKLQACLKGEAGINNAQLKEIIRMASNKHNFDLLRHHESIVTLRRGIMEKLRSYLGE